jgi:hypothetical protein
MSHGPEHHLEEAEHARHARHDPSDRRVALSMAILAAALASATLLGHRAHTEMLGSFTKETNQWNYYQAKKNRLYMYEADAELLDALAPDAAGSEAGKKNAERIQGWKAKAGKYEKDAEEIKEKAEGWERVGHAAHHSANFFDVGELCLALALVLCSVSLLTKRPAFWWFGLAIGVIGLAVVVGGFWADPIMKTLWPA